ncbi:MAG: site-specific DNA-methyltransferase [Gemmatimonadetes bacterium]|nr:site-specific DNA-methyltransferase [Gemmatimonadota bacterium]
MPKPPRKPPAEKAVEALTYPEARRPNIPTAEYQAMLASSSPVQVAYARRNRDLDPQLVWRGKDEQDAASLVVNAPPLYIQEKVHPKALVDDLLRQTREQQHERGELMADLFADFNGIPKDADKTEFYQHDQNWTNRMILGDSLQVMASLAEREGLRGKVQCIYFDPPYGIKFNSNFQWSTTSRDVKDGNAAHITREPEQVKAFRDTWRDGIHSYLTYLRDRLEIARDLLHESGSIFVQIGDENVHRVRELLDEIMGEENIVSQIPFAKTSGATSSQLAATCDYLLWYAKDRASSVRKYRQLRVEVDPIPNADERYVCVETDNGEIIDLSVKQKQNPVLRPQGRVLRLRPTDSQGATEDSETPVAWRGRNYFPPSGRHWSVTSALMPTVVRSDRAFGVGSTLTWKYYREPNFVKLTNDWSDLKKSGFGSDQLYVVETMPAVVQRCIQMSTDPGDLVLDPTCGSGTTAYVAEQWGRRWITIDTSRVALALARARIMGARYPSYLLADSREGQLKEAEVTRTAPSSAPTGGNIRLGFVYERVPHVTLKSIANNAEIDVIWEAYQAKLEPLRAALNTALKKTWEEWEIPRDADDKWPAAAKDTHKQWWEARIARQREIDASIAAKADTEYLYDRPYEDKKKVRVAGPFTVESLSPHRMLGVDEHGATVDAVMERKTGYASGRDFPSMVLDNLRAAGVQQAAKADRIAFTAITAWPGDLVCADGRYLEGGTEKRAAIFIGPEFGTVTRPDLVAAAREASESGFDVLIACAFNFEAHTTEFAKLGKVPVLKARMNADLHMAEDLKKTDKANLFVVFGEPDIEVQDAGSGRIRVKVNGVDVFDPSTGEVRSDDADGIACWFIDTDYNEESFFVRQAYFLGANDPYKALKTTLKAEINADAWASLNSDTSRPFLRPSSGRIAVKVINHLGDEVMKVMRV